MSSAVLLTGVTFAWPDGTPVLTGLDGTFGARRTGLIGLNGAGKSTLLRLIAGEPAPQIAGGLSGGERFRAVLAALLLAAPAPQLLLLDEPTDNLDLAGVRQLTQALDAYRGALVVASHDLPFLEGLGITRWLRTARMSGLLEKMP